MFEYQIMCLSFSGQTAVFICVFFPLHFFDFLLCMNFHLGFSHLPLPLTPFPPHNLFFPNSLLSYITPLPSTLPTPLSRFSTLLSFDHISILPSISLPISLTPILSLITPTIPPVLSWVQACRCISQCYLHVNSSSQIFTIVPGGESPRQGWDDSPFVNTVNPK